ARPRVRVTGFGGAGVPPAPARRRGPPPTPRTRLLAHAVRVASLPCFAAAVALDTLRTAAARRTDGGNAYRMLARKDVP
ncbi:hypothetical protein ACFVZQ_37570, partial [Streptomyces sp. NPDC059538]